MGRSKKPLGSIRSLVRRRLVLKTVGWRLLALAGEAVVVLLTGRTGFGFLDVDLVDGIKLVVILNAGKALIYYLYDLLWERIAGSTQCIGRDKRC